MISDDPIFIPRRDRALARIPGVIFCLPYVFNSVSKIPLNQAAVTKWDDLSAQSAEPDAASGGAAWQTCSQEVLQGAEPAIIFVQSDDSQIALSITATPWGLKLQPLESLWKFGTPLLGPNAPMLLSDIIHQIRSLAPKVRIKIELPGGVYGSHQRDLQRIFPHTKRRPHWEHGAASLAGGFDGYLGRRSAGFRRALKRATRRAKDNGIEFECRLPLGPRAAYETYKRMEAIERASWKGRWRAGLFELPEFYYKLLSKYSYRSQARVVFARRDNSDIGYCFGGVVGDIYRGQQSSYRQDAANYSLGMLMHVETAKWLCRQGKSLQHFGPIQRGMDYKFRFCELTTPSVLTSITID